MEQPHYDFIRPTTFLNALESFSLALSCVMIALRDEAQFREEPDQAHLNAAHMLASMLQDAQAEASALSDVIERRMSGGM